MAGYVVQSLALRRDKFTKGGAFDWIRKHGYKADKVDIGPHFFRFRQVNPERLAGGRFRTIALGDVAHMTVFYFA
jgi:hypothetical protein